MSNSFVENQQKFVPK